MKAKILFAAIFIGMLLSACSPRIVEHIRTEIEYRDRYIRDSLYFRDSVFMKEYIKGDTVFQDREVYKYVYKDRLKTDTLLREVHDTTTVEVQVEKPLSAPQRLKIGAFWWLLGAVVLLLLWTFRKTIFKIV